MITDAELHVRGQAHFVDDLQHPENLLHAITFCSSVAHAEIINLDITAALAVDGVIAIFSAKDVIGRNQIGGLVEDEPLFAEKQVFYIGESIALVVATTPEIARAARNAIHCEYKEKEAIFDAREAYAKGLIHPPERSFVLGDVDKVWADCDLVIEGQANNGAQEHVYMETQSALAVPLEHGGVKLYAATQSPSMTQKMAAQVLGCAMHQVEVDVLRLGGAFGGKEEQATRWAVFAALAASQLKQPVKIVLNRDEDMALTGKRHPYSSDFKIGLSKQGKILAYQVYYYQNAGATNDLSPAILDRSLFHITNSYFIPNVQATAVSCKTNLPSNTAFRGFGAPQAMFVIESAIHQAAQTLGIDAAEIQAKNLLQENDVFPYGMAVKYCQATNCWDEVQQRYQVAKRQAEIAEFNQQHPLHKKALALMPVCFAISFNTTFLNQARALVHIYTDGSVGVSSSAVEMGQGVKAKIRQIAATVLGIDINKVKLESTNTTRISNMSPTSASVGADLNGHATRLACEAILQRLQKVAADAFNTRGIIKIEGEIVYLDNQATDLSWQQLITQAYFQRVNLSAQAHYATPNVSWDWDAGPVQKPFAYHVFGTAVTEVTLDCLLGTYTVDTVKVVHDAGHSLNALIDRGQVEGGLVQGLGWMTLEEIKHNNKGDLLSHNLANYKIPDIYFAPEIEVHFLAHADNPVGLFGSKAVGEPPFMYGIGVYFALLNAMREFNPKVNISYDAPLTPEKVLMALYPA